MERKNTVSCTDFEEKKTSKRAKERDQKWSKICTQKQKKRKKKEKKSRPFPFAFVCTRNTYKEREREKARVYERKKKMSENIINKDNNKQMTTRERQHIEVAKLEAELNALKVDAFAKVRVVVVVFSSSSYVGCAF